MKVIESEHDEIFENQYLIRAIVQADEPKVYLQIDKSDRASA